MSLASFKVSKHKHKLVKYFSRRKEEKKMKKINRFSKLFQQFLNKWQGAPRK